MPENTNILMIRPAEKPDSGSRSGTLRLKADLFILMFFWSAYQTYKFHLNTKSGESQVL